MGQLEAHDTKILATYEGLVFATARLIDPVVEDDIEDCQQVLRLKVFRALLAYDVVRSRGLSRDNYVFMCVRDQAKDMLKKRKRGELHIEDLAPESFEEGARLSSRDRFDARYLSSSHDEVYGEIEDDLLLPNTLSKREIDVLLLLYRDFNRIEAARALKVRRRDIEEAVASLREKLADWRPTALPTELKPAAAHVQPPTQVSPYSRAA